MLTFKQGTSAYYLRCVEDRRYTVAKYAKDGGGWFYMAWFAAGKDDLKRLNEYQNTDKAASFAAANAHFDAAQLPKAA